MKLPLILDLCDLKMMAIELLKVGFPLIEVPPPLHTIRAPTFFGTF